MQKIKNISKYKILLAAIITIFMIGSFYSPIVTSDPVTSIVLEKYVWDGSNYQDADNPTGPYLPSTQDPVIFKFTINNNGLLDLTTINLSDTDITTFYTDETCTIIATFPTTLDVGETKIFYGKLPWAAGQHNNTATANDSCSGVSDVDWANYYGISASINLEKYVWDGSNYQDADNPTGPYLPSTQDPVIFKFTIHNNGNINLTNVILTDTDMTTFYTDDACTIIATFPTTLDMGETKIFYGKLPWAAGQHNNTATATDNTAGVSDVDWANYYGICASIDIEKFVSVDCGENWFDADTATGPSIDAGDIVKFKVNVTNTGCVDLTGIVVTDTDFTFTGVVTSLAPGAYDESDIIEVIAECGQQWDKASVVGTPPFGPDVTDYDFAYYIGSCPCQDIVWIDDDFDPTTPDWLITNFSIKQLALDSLQTNGTAYVYDGTYNEDIIIDDVPCNNTGITQKGEYGCFPINESAIIQGSETIKVNNVTIKYLEYTPNTNGSIIIYPDVNGTIIRCNKFNKNCINDSIGIKSFSTHPVNAELNWWGVPDGPSGGKMDDGATADGNGVKVIGDNVDVEPWIGIHAEINNPDNHTTVIIGEPILFDATGSWAYTYSECCQSPVELHMQYLWDFDDGRYSSNKVANHIYYETGTYQVKLMVDAPGIPGLYPNFMFDWAYVTIHVVTEETNLTANADGGNLGGYETMVNEPLQLYGDAYGGNGDYTWYWNFGDQTIDSTLQNPVHTYTKPGTYIATLTVKSNGETATDTATVLVYDIDELFVNINDANTIVGTETMFTASITGGTPPYTVNWDFGDGATSQENNPIHIYNSPGVYTITVTVTDDKQKTAIDTATITVEEENIIELAEIKDVKGGLGVQAIIAAGDNNCVWEITVEGNVFFGGENSGIINANTQETIRLGFSLAIGNVDIKVKAADIQKHYTAFALGPFYINLKEI